MKKQILIAVALALFATAKTQAQGYFTFGNAGGGVNAPVFEADGTTKLTTAYKADFVYGTTAASLATGSTSLAAPVTFAGSGLFLGGKQTINDQSGSVFVEVRAWRTADGAAFATASAAPGGHWGVSAPVQVTLGVGTAPVPPLLGLQSFNLQINPVPEPSTIALGVLGLSALLFRRRK